MHPLLLDARSALRFFARHRAATAVLILTMALALAANTAAFSVLRSCLFGELGVPAADRVVFVWTVRQLDGRGAVNFFDAYPNVRLLRDGTRFWESLAATLGVDVNWQRTDGAAVRLQGVRAEAEFFRVMRVQPVLGRAFTSAEQGPRAAPVALISAALWRREFAGSPHVLGRALRLNGEPHTIIGVLPDGFAQPRGTDIWLPFDLPENMWHLVIGGRQLGVYARLGAGVSTSAAREELRQFASRAVEANPENKDWSWTVQPIREALLDGAEHALALVQAGAAILLVLAASNLVSLLLAWVMERERETSLRLVLGATAGSIARQFLVKSLLLVIPGGMLGLALVHATLPLLQHLNPNPGLSFALSQLRIDATALAFTGALVLGTAGLAGMVPSLHACRTTFAAALQNESRGASVSRATLRWQRVMVVIQAGVAVLILTGATVAATGFARLSRVRLGFQAEDRAAFQIQFPEPAYATHEKRAEFVRQLEQNLAREPAVRSFGFSTTLPAGDTQWGGGFHPQLPTGEFTTEPQVFHVRRVSPGYLATIGVPLLEGRGFTARDSVRAPHVALISRAAAEKYWPGRSPLGRKLRRAAPKDAPLLEIVGVVADVRDAGPGAPDAETVYLAFDQISLRRGWIVMHGANPAELLAAGRRALRSTDPEVALYNAGALVERVRTATALPRLQAALLGAFAAVAITITALGSYGVMSQLVASRRRELAIRAALGADRGSVLRLVLWSNARLAVTGAATGLLAAVLACRWLQAKLSGFNAGEAWPYVVVLTLVVVLTQLASLIPARRAARNDPVDALFTA